MSADASLASDAEDESALSDHPFDHDRADVRTHGLPVAVNRDDPTAELDEEFDDDDDDGLEQVSGGPQRSGVIRFFAEWGVVLVVALLVAVLVRMFLFSPFYIPSISMEPTLKVHDKILVNQLSYKLHDVHRGDVVVFDAPPAGHFDSDIKDLVKRVVGLPGDTIAIHDCLVYVSGQLLVEPYVQKAASGHAVCTDPAGPAVDPDRNGSFVVPAGQVFVMGDNRGHSDDGRFWGFLDQKLIVGRAFVIYWPISRWSWL